jgi:hypothetical protein
LQAALLPKGGSSLLFAPEFLIFGSLSITGSSGMTNWKSPRRRGRLYISPFPLDDVWQEIRWRHAGKLKRFPSLT